jgi:site-specific DNA-methyltransferase (adenine-specific)/adenine-specific DNA-methyltransferase
MVLEPLSESTIAKYKYEDEIGRYRLNGRNIKGSPIRSAKDVDDIWEQTHPEWVVRDYLREGKVPSDYFFVDIENQASNVRTGYPTQKPEELLYKLISASSNAGDIVFDCFMGSGTTQAVAMKLGRRFIGADINLGAVQITTRRLVQVAKDLTAKAAAPAKPQPLPGLSPDVDEDDPEQADAPAEPTIFYTGFEVYNVNHYDIFRNPVEAKDLLLQALEVEPLPAGHLYDGVKDGRFVKVLPVNRIATRADLNDLVANFNYKDFERKRHENPTKPVERITLVCMGHDPDLAATLKDSVQPYLLDVQVYDVLRDGQHLQFKRDAEAHVVARAGRLVIEAFYPMNLLAKLSLQKEVVEDWRELAESVMIDWNYDGAVFTPAMVDIPEKNAFVAGSYPIPPDAGTIRVKITDLLSESWEGDVRHAA